MYMWKSEAILQCWQISRREVLKSTKKMSRDATWGWWGLWIVEIHGSVFPCFVLKVWLAAMQHLQSYCMLLYFSSPKKWTMFCYHCIKEIIIHPCITWPLLVQNNIVSHFQPLITIILHNAYITPHTHYLKTGPIWHRPWCNRKHLSYLQV